MAVFDVDGTLTVRDCVVPFARRVAGTPRLLLASVGRSATLLPLLLRRDRDAVKELFTRLTFTGRDADEVDRAGVVFADHVYHHWMRRDVAERFRWHQEQGHVVVLVSASFDAYLEPLGDLLEADAVLCTRLERIGGSLTGRLDGANCRGAEKVRRIEQWCAESGVPIGAVRYAYGDTAGDAAMLELATHRFDVSELELERSAP